MLLPPRGGSTHTRRPAPNPERLQGGPYPTARRPSPAPNPERLQGGPYPTAGPRSYGPGTPGVGRAGAGWPGSAPAPPRRTRGAGGGGGAGGRGGGARKKQLTLQQALKRAGVHQTPYGGGPWSIFTHGGGDVVAKAWAVELLKQIGAPTTAGNVAFVYNWEVSEGGGGKFNPLNQGPVPGQPGLTSTGQQYGGGAADFTSWGAGLKGAAAYLAMPDFRGIAGALRANDPVAARAALIQSPWAASHYGYGSGFANQAPPGASIPALPPLLGGSGGGMGGGVSSRLTGPTGPSGTGGGPGSAPSGTGTGGGGGSGRAGTGGGGGQGGGGATGPDPAIAVASGGTIATTAETGTPGPGGGLGSNPILFPFVEGLDLTKQAFTTVVAPGAALAAISNNFRAFLHGIDWLFVPSHWVRILAFFGGVTSVGTGVVFLSFSSSGLPGSHVTKPAALPLGIASVGFGGILLFIAFHNVPTQVIDLPSLLSWLETEFHKGASSAPVSTAVSGVTAL